MAINKVQQAVARGIKPRLYPPNPDDAADAPASGIDCLVSALEVPNQ